MSAKKTALALRFITFPCDRPNYVTISAYAASETENPSKDSTGVTLVGVLFEKQKG